MNTQHLDYEMESNHPSMEATTDDEAGSTQTRLLMDARNLEVEEPVISQKAKNEPQGHRREAPLIKRIGVWSLIVVVLSAIVLIFALGFLSWIWYGGRSNSNWRRIMIKGWSKQAVTLSAILIRLAISSLATLATSMIAAIAIERRGVPLHIFPQVSIARYANTGPDTLWISTFTDKAFLSRRLRLLLILLLTTTIASQFSSTLLLSDFSQGSVTGFSSSQQVGLASSSMTVAGMDIDDIIEDNPLPPNYWSHYPKQFATFAEYSEPGNSSDAVDDTGVSLRSFLPLSDVTERQNILEYTGAAAVFDTRVVCVQPNFTTLSFNASSLSGQLMYSDSIPGKQKSVKPVRGNVTDEFLELGTSFTSSYSVRPTNFTCNIASSPKWSKTLCVLKGYTTDVLPLQNGSSIWMIDGLVSALDPFYNETATTLPLVKQGDAFPVNTGNMHLIIEPPRSPGAVIKWEPSTGPWSAVTIRNVTKNFDCSTCWEDLTKNNCSSHCIQRVFRTSLCFDALPPPADMYTIQDFNISMSSPKSRLEPGVTPMSNGSLYTGNIRRQLGVTKQPLDLDTRGILQLEGKALLKDLAQRREFFQSFNLSSLKGVDEIPELNPNMRWPATLGDNYWTPAIAFSSGRSYTVADPNDAVLGIFNDTLNDTDSPAKALQAVLTVLLGMAYYDPLQFTNYPTSASLTYSESALMPLNQRGLVAVFCIICAHVLICMFVAVEFVRNTKKSYLGNAWQAVAQVSNNTEVARMLEGTDMKTDKEVTCQLNEHGGELRRRNLVRAE
ncbi:hypothetical protein BT63DRAFT_454080 [Microthyrium microscopicum]|uniref:Uncharacterized protein n=1 Tax=Microthyrium microscopicum TaxID=703497 RepID=A0A6A6UFM7_9PEZI|nr:hypothetical protein BT63DRAFT_454080 [Microthyrium microscopicum]